MTATPDVREALEAKLRRFGEHTRTTSRGGMEAEARIMEEAADHIATLTAEVERLREKLGQVEAADYLMAIDDRNYAEDQLAAMTERAGKDAERLTWLGDGGWRRLPYTENWGSAAWLRAAIDKARSQA